MVQQGHEHIREADEIDDHVAGAEHAKHKAMTPLCSVFLTYELVRCCCLRVTQTRSLRRSRRVAHSKLCNAPTGMRSLVSGLHLLDSSARRLTSKCVASSSLSFAEPDTQQQEVSPPPRPITLELPHTSGWPQECHAHVQQHQEQHLHEKEAFEAAKQRQAQRSGADASIHLPRVLDSTQASNQHEHFAASYAAPAVTSSTALPRSQELSQDLKPAAYLFGKQTEVSSIASVSAAIPHDTHFASPPILAATAVPPPAYVPFSRSDTSSSAAPRLQPALQSAVPSAALATSTHAIVETTTTLAAPSTRPLESVVAEAVASAPTESETPVQSNAAPGVCERTTALAQQEREDPPVQSSFTAGRVSNALSDMTATHDMKAQSTRLPDNVDDTPEELASPALSIAHTRDTGESAEGQTSAKDPTSVFAAVGSVASSFGGLSDSMLASHEAMSPLPGSERKVDLTLDLLLSVDSSTAELGVASLTTPTEKQATSQFQSSVVSADVGHTSQEVEKLPTSAEAVTATADTTRSAPSPSTTRENDNTSSLFTKAIDEASDERLDDISHASTTPSAATEADLIESTPPTADTLDGDDAQIASFIAVARTLSRDGEATAVSALDASVTDALSSIETLNEAPTVSLIDQQDAAIDESVTGGQSASLSPDTAPIAPASDEAPVKEVRLQPERAAACAISLSYSCTDSLVVITRPCLSMRTLRRSSRLLRSSHSRTKPKCLSH